MDIFVVNIGSKNTSSAPSTLDILSGNINSGKLAATLMSGATSARNTGSGVAATNSEVATRIFEAVNATG